MVDYDEPEDVGKWWEEHGGEVDPILPDEIDEENVISLETLQTEEEGDVDDDDDDD